MPWYIWLLIVLVLGSIVSGLVMLLRTANDNPLTPEQLEKVRQRQLELDAQDRREEKERG
ncbi:DUF2897 family protein [Pseudomonas xionganensis]|uniref:DUF2897 family protein n=1 Tax=Pseudomonas xionganensis TaxID=2654845 RepID=A0A6I4L1U4_9PSED|nr:DUF2897 family protein [Pseudomonas xionganensis]MVW77092.1 DUF2897 family protein [Pseudomonas xionganensis]